MQEPSRSDSALLSVRVQPRSSREEVLGWEGTTLRVRVRAAPVDGAANQAVRELLARSLGLPLSAVVLVKGARGRAKLIRIEGHSFETVKVRLRAARP